MKRILSFLKEFRLVLMLGLFLLVLGFVLGNKLIFAPRESAFKTISVKKKNLVLIVSATGKIKSDEEATLKFQTSGNLVWVGAKKGDQVEKWQAVASLDKEELEKTLKQELIDYMNERWDYEQITIDDYKDIALTETIRRAKEQAQFDLDRTVLDVEIANIALKYSNLVSPIKGIVTESDFTHAGVNINHLTYQMIISNPDKLVFNANIDEVDIGRLQPGQTATIILDAYPEEEITAYLQEIDFTSTITSGGGTAFAAKFRLPDNTPNQKFRLGMNGDVDIFVSRIADVITVPFEAVQEDEEGNYVWIIENGKPRRQKVETGVSDDVDTQIISGLNEGETVITSGFRNFGATGFQ